MTQASEQEATRPRDVARVNLTSKELAPGRDHAFTTDHAASAAGLVIGERGVLVVGRILNADRASQLVALIRQSMTKPIRFLLNKA